MTSVQLPWQNPVLARELKQRMSTPRIMLVITLYLVVLGAIVLGLYNARTGQRTGGFGQAGITQVATIGQGLFEWVLFFMALLVLFIVPGFTAASIAGERERQTLRAMQISLLSPFGIVVGKVMASVALTMLLLVASLPLLAVSYLIGGITFGEILISLGVLLFAAFSLSCITVACSSLVKGVTGSILLAYGIVIAMVGGSFIAFGVLSEIDQSRGFDQADPPSWVMATNPLVAIADVADRGSGPQLDPFGNVIFGPFGPVTNNTDSPLSFIRSMTESRFNQFGEIGFPEPIPVDIGGAIPEARDLQADRIPIVGEFLITSSVLAVIGLVVATRRLRTPAATER